MVFCTDQVTLSRPLPRPTFYGFRFAKGLSGFFLVFFSLVFNLMDRKQTRRLLDVSTARKPAAFRHLASGVPAMRVGTTFYPFQFPSSHLDLTT